MGEADIDVDVVLDEMKHRDMIQDIAADGESVRRLPVGECKLLPIGRLNVLLGVFLNKIGGPLRALRTETMFVITVEVAFADRIDQSLRSPSCQPDIVGDAVLVYWQQVVAEG